jgi:hypothetical protein
MSVHLPRHHQEIDFIIRELTRGFGDRVHNERIVNEAEKAYEGLSSSSKVKTFVPVLALRRARERLHFVARPADEATTSTEEPPCAGRRAGGNAHWFPDAVSATDAGPEPRRVNPSRSLSPADSKEPTWQ